MGCSRARHRADGGVCHSSVRQRTTANEPANHGPRFTPHCWLTRHTPRTTPTQAHPRWRPGGSAPQTPRDLSPLCQARREKQKRDAQRIPSPILAPESALGSRLRVALSSARVIHDFTPYKIVERPAVRADRQVASCTPGPSRLEAYRWILMSMAVRDRLDSEQQSSCRPDSKGHESSHPASSMPSHF